MQQLNGRVAVVTGGASGIGRGLMNRFAAEGMKVVVVVADVEEDPLDQVVQAVRENRFYVLTHPTWPLADMRQRPQWMESAIAPEITITRSGS